MVEVKKNNKIVNYHCINGEMEYKALFKKKTRNNAIATHSDTKSNIPGGLCFAISLLYSTYPINKRAEHNWLWIYSTQNWEENKSLIIGGRLETAR